MDAIQFIVSTKYLPRNPSDWIQASGYKSAFYVCIY